MPLLGSKGLRATRGLPQTSTPFSRRVQTFLWLNEDPPKLDPWEGPAGCSLSGTRPAYLVSSDEEQGPGRRQGPQLAQLRGSLCPGLTEQGGRGLGLTVTGVLCALLPLGGDLGWAGGQGGGG